MARLVLLIGCAILLVRGTGGRRCASPTLFAAAMTGLGVQDYDHELHELDPRQKCRATKGPFRTIDGTCNNERNLGAANTRLDRLLPAAYDDGFDAPRTLGERGQPLASARFISLATLPDRRTSRNDNTLLLMQWGQFLDHDMTLMPLPTERIQEEDAEPLVCCRRFRIGTVNPLPSDCFPITFSPDTDFIGTCMEFVRTIPAMRLRRDDKREQINSITAFIDASSVYGSSLEEEEELRESDGHGYLLKFEHSPEGPLLPRTERNICRREADDPLEEPVCFIAGDERVNEQPALATIHTVFLRLHNIIATKMAASLQPFRSPDLASALAVNESVFQSTRRVVGAIVQNIMYSEWLPIILGPHYMEEFQLTVDGRSDYDPELNATILNEFSTAAYRLGHSLVPRNLPTPDPSFRRLSIPLREHFLRPAVVRERFNALAMGLVMANRTTRRFQSQAIDSTVSRDLSEHLFEPSDRRGQDLMALNIQRGRDHGLQPYNQYRRQLGLRPVTGFDDPAISRSTNLDLVYDSVEDIDLFVGGLAEPPNAGGGQLGDTFSGIVARQMRRLKFGDRFFFTHRSFEGTLVFDDDQLDQLRGITAAKVMCVTVDVIDSLQPNAFVEQGPRNRPVPCGRLIADFSRDFLNAQDFFVPAKESQVRG